jgi:tetratricopeptide (TPR) repeat protein
MAPAAEDDGTSGAAPPVPPRALPAPPRALIEAELEQIAASAPFRRSAQLVRFLHHLVDHGLAGRLNELREIVIGVAVFDRSASRFDPRHDSIVRVQAGRLREKLQRYYEAPGPVSAVEIGLPVGSYIPTFRRRSERREAASTAARDLVERGQYFLRQGGEANLLKAIERFDLALREDPDYPSAHLGIARGWINIVGEYYRAPMPWIDYATEALARAVRLDPRNPEALMLLGSLLYRYDYDWDGAAVCFDRALALAPDNAFVQTAHGFHLLLAGHAEAAETALKAARRIDPHYVNSRWHMVFLRITQRRWDDVEKEAAALADVMPEDSRVIGLVATVHLYTGRPRAALDLFRQVEAMAPQLPLGLVGSAQAQLMLGEVEAANFIVAELHRRFADHYLSPYQLALIEMRRARPEAALRLLDDAARQRDPSVIFAATEPTFDPLRDEPLFKTLLTRHRRNSVPTLPL